MMMMMIIIIIIIIIIIAYFIHNFVNGIPCFFKNITVKETGKLLTEVLSPFKNNESHKTEAVVTLIVIFGLLTINIKCFFIEAMTFSLVSTFSVQLALLLRNVCQDSFRIRLFGMHTAISYQITCLFISLVRKAYPSQPSGNYTYHQIYQ
jgi:hypothetical protein